MDIIVDKDTLLKALSHSQSAVERRNTIPILSHVKLAAEGDELVLSATDMEISLTESVASRNGKGGVITAPAVKLREIVGKLPDGSEVHLQSDDNDEQLKLTCGQAKFSLQLLPVSEFPSISEGELPTKFTLSVEVLKRLLDKTSLAMSTEETRYYLNGIYFHTKAIEAEGKKKKASLLVAVATDGHRLAKAEIDAPTGCDFSDGVIVPRKAIQELVRLLDEGSGDVEIALSDTKIRFSIGSIVLISKLIDGTFPDYERVIPTDNTIFASLDCKAFKSVVDRVSTISSERLRGVKLSLVKGSLKVSAVNPSQGSAEEDMTAKYDGDDSEIGFNAQYLLDIANQVSKGSLEMRFADSVSPALISDSDDDGLLYVLMPIRV